MASTQLMLDQRIASNWEARLVFPSSFPRVFFGQIPRLSALPRAGLGAMFLSGHHCSSLRFGLSVPCQNLPVPQMAKSSLRFRRGNLCVGSRSAPWMTDAGLPGNCTGVKRSKMAPLWMLLFWFYFSGFFCLFVWSQTRTQKDVICK